MCIRDSFQGGIRSGNQGGLDGTMAKFPVCDGNAHAGSFHPIGPEPGAHSLRKGQYDLPGRLPIRHIKRRGHRIAVPLIPWKFP